MDFFGFILPIGILFGLFFLWLSVKAPPPPPAMRPAPPPPPRRVPAMSFNANRTLRMMRDGRTVPARSLALEIGLPVTGVLTAQRELRALGLAKYGPAVNDNGKFAGSGYGLTQAGVEIQRRLSAAA